MAMQWRALMMLILMASAACGGDDSTRDTPGSGGEGGEGSGSGSGSGSGGEGNTSSGEGASGPATTGSGASGSSTTGSGGNPSGCPASVTCVEQFPFDDARDTSSEGSLLFDVYSCDDADESGPEIAYQVTIPNDGTLTATVTDGDGVDIDVQILSDYQSGACVARDDVTVTANVMKGVAWVTADTYVSGGVPQVGPFTLTIDFTAQ